MRISYLRAVTLCAVALTATPANSQSLDEQYEFFLSRRCEELGFVLDPFDLVPGQAGPNLTRHCETPETGGFGLIVVNTTTGGGAAAGIGRGGFNDEALRRRREDERDTGTNYSARGNDISTDSSWIDGLSLFASTDYRDERQDVTRYEGGRRGRSNTLTAGADYRMRSLLAGVALQGERLSGDFASGGEFENRGYGLTLYVSWSPLDAAFVDFNVGAECKAIETTRIVGRTISETPDGGGPTEIKYRPAFAPVYGDTDSQALRAEMRLGYDFALSRYTVGPRIAANYRRNDTDGYIETGNSAMSLALDDQTETSFQVGAGLQASAAFTVRNLVLAPQFDASWIHELRNDQRAIGARFAEDIRPNPRRFTFLNQPPDRNTYIARLSVVAALPSGVSAFVGSERLFGHAFRDRYGVNAGMRWEL